MTTRTATRTIILAAIDYSEGSACVVEHALALARLRLPCDLHFLHVKDERAHEEPRDSRAELLDWLRSRLPPDEVRNGITIIAREAPGKAATVITQVAFNLHCTAIVVGTRGKAALGPVAEAVANQAPCSVFIARRKAIDNAQSEPPGAQCMERQLHTY